jgi:DNA repair exonuclease SbcCD nuclease subunit
MNFLKRFSVLVLSTAVLISSICVTPVFASGKLNYEFKGDEKDKPGYAEGKITLSSVPSGKYSLYWADDTKALDGFYEIAEIKSGTSFSFKEHNAIPADATKLIACSGKDTTVKNAAAVYDIPKNKQLKYKSEDANYTFMNYSDIHIDQADNPYYKYSELHFKKALETAERRKTDFIITAGDNITNAEGPGKEFDKFQEILSDSDYQGYVYEGSGNHELRTGSPKDSLNAFIKATGLDGDLKTIAKNNPYYSVVEPKTGDLFIFMSLEFLFSPDKGDEFTKEQLDWFENLLKENYKKNKNIFVIQHALIEGYGAGDDEDNFYTVPLHTEHKTTVRFRKLLESYPNITWISGHTHIALKYGYNYSNMNDTSCNMIHDSSVCCPTLLNYSSHNLSYAAANNEEYKDLTEGYYVQVFDDATIYNGENLYHDKIYPAATYIINGGRTSYTANTGTQILKAFDSNIQNYIFDKDADIESKAVLAITMPKAFNPVKINSKDIKELIKKSNELLNETYSFSSYNDYTDLKRAVKNAQSDENKQKAYKELSDAYINMLKYTKDGNITVYFTNTNEWDNVYAKLFSSKLNNGNKGEKMTYVKKDSDGYKVYKIDVNINKYNQVIFTNGTDKEISETQTLSKDNNKLYYLNNNDLYSPYYIYIRDYK